MRAVQVNVAFDPRLTTPDALLDAYHTLTRWSDALVSAGLSAAVFQAFGDGAPVHRRGVDYVFRRQQPYDHDPLLQAVLACEPDIVHVNGFEAQQVSRRLRRVLPQSVPMVFQHHGGRPPRRLGASGRSMRTTMKQGDAFLFTSLAQAQPWIDRGYIDRAAAVFDVLEASTAIRPIPPEDARAQTEMRGSPSVLWVGRLDANKDPLV